MTTRQSILNRLTEEVSGSDKELFDDSLLNEFADFYIDKWDENTSGYVIAESLVDAVWSKPNTCRRCSECGKLFTEGYCVNSGDDYYCSDECLHKNFTPAEWEEECNTNDQSYYTEFR